MTEYHGENGGDGLKCSIESRYESEVLQFYDWLETNPNVGASAIALWHALMYTWRRAGYPDQITVATSTLESKTRLSRSTIKRIRNTLKQAGRIDWFERKGNQSAVYRILPFELVAHDRPQHGLQAGPQTGPQMSHKLDPLYNNNNIDTDNVVVVSNGVQNGPQTEPQNKLVAHDRPQHGLQTGNPGIPEGFNKHEQAARTVQKHYEQNLGSLLSSTAILEIIDFLEAGIEAALICRAIDASIDAGARNWVYAKRALDNCIVKKVFTLEQYAVAEANRNASKARMNRNGGIPDGSSRGNTRPGEHKPDPYERITSTKL